MAVFYSAENGEISAAKAVIQTQHCRFRFCLVKCCSKKIITEKMYQVRLLK